VDGNELGTFLRTRRAKVSPADVSLPDVSLPDGERRRGPGLRRDEVARLTGISLDYYTEIEQGRATHPSAQVLTALSRCLHLDYDEQSYLFGLAECAVPPVADPRASRSLLDLLGRLADTPAMIITDLHQVIVQNSLAEALLGDQTDWRGGFAYRWFAEPDARTVYPDQDHAYHSAIFVADLRVAVMRRRGDIESAQLVARLTELSPEFAALWRRGDVSVRHRVRNRILHPSLGEIDLRCDRVFSSDERQRLLWFSAEEGSLGAAKLESLKLMPQNVG
jgi:transcriptional regulator with XRE-family HTH domain